MTRFHCIAIPTETAVRFRRTGIDDRGNPLRRVEATAEGGFPCRHCLRLGQPGETMLLGSYDLPRPLGTYWTPSPIFLHASDCARFAAEDALPETILCNTLVSVRAYDGAEQCLYDLGHVCDGADALPPVRRALEDGRTSFVNVHTARPGCWLGRVERVA